jgi:hypothetical protein
MKAEELRVGFWYLYDGDPLQLTQERLSYILQVGGEYKYEPIPLTEEWLLKLGLIESGYKQMYGNEYYKDGLSIYLEGGEYRFYTSTNRAYTSYEYVHEIQNLFSALGCELNVKE